jgi:hypothetical protein
MATGDYMRRRDAAEAQALSTDEGCEVLCVLHRV